VLLSAVDRAAVSQRIAFAPLFATRGDHFAVSVPGFFQEAHILICLRFLRRSGRTERTRRAERSSVVNCEQAIEAIQQGLGGAYDLGVGRHAPGGTKKSRHGAVELGR
jgi:hypothetical protein